MEDAAVEFESQTIGLSVQEMLNVQHWLAELKASCSESRAGTLVSQLSRTLQGYMGIDQELLCAAFWSDYRRGTNSTRLQR